MVASSGRTTRSVITRRSFLKAALAAGGAAALPLSGLSRDLLGSMGLASTTATGPQPLTKWGGPFFLVTEYTDPSTKKTHNLYAVASALCDNIVPGGSSGPGASAAGAVNYIDVFMAAFQENLLASGLVSTSPIYLSGPFSGRWPFGNDRGGEGSAAPDSFENSKGQIQFLGLTPAQALAWYLRIYGSSPTDAPSWVSSTWLKQVASNAGATGSPPTIPGAQNLRSLYLAGLSAFDDWSQQNFGTGFAQASSPEQEALVTLAANPVVGAASENGLPGLPSPLPNPVPPAAAASLFGVMVLHTIQGTYCLPEYNGLSDKALGGQVTWASIGFDGDTVPLGNSIYDESIDENQPAEPDNVFSNSGFGFPAGASTNPPGAFTPKGAYVEFRPVSHPDPNSGATEADVADFTQLIGALKKAGATVTEFTGG